MGEKRKKDKKEIGEEKEQQEEGEDGSLLCDLVTTASWAVCPSWPSRCDFTLTTSIHFLKTEFSGHWYSPLSSSTLVYVFKFRDAYKSMQMYQKAGFPPNRVPQMSEVREKSVLS